MPHEDVIYAHQTSCMEHIVANVYLLGKKRLSYKWYLQVGIPDVSRTVSGSDAAIILVPLKASTKMKPSHSAPLLTPASPPPTTSIISSSSFDSPLASKHSTLVTVFSSTTISATGFGYNGGCTTDTTYPMLESVSAKGEVTSSGAKLDIL